MLRLHPSKNSMVLYAIFRLRVKHTLNPIFCALQEFIENEGDGEPPLEGSIPDMTSLTELVSDVS